MTETKTQTEIQTETKQNVPRSKKKLATILFLVLLFLILLVSVTTPSSQPSKNDTQQTTTANENAPVSDTTESLLSQTSTIMYRPSPNELFDALPDGTGAIDLSSIVGLSNESPLEAIKMLPDKKDFYFVHEHYLWLTDIQGKQVKEFPNLQDNIVDISLLLMDSKGNLLFVITDRQQHNSFYYYELSTNTLTPLENNANQYDHNKAFLQLSDTSFSYFNYDDRYLYKSDINAGKPTRLSSVPLPTSPTTIQNPVIDNLFLDNTTSVIYTIQPSDTSIYQSSGIFLFNYQTNQRTQISPENDAQGRYLPLTFSPDKTKLLELSGSKDTIVKGVNTLSEMIDKLKAPRKIMMLVPAGNPVDSVIGDLAPLLQQGLRIRDSIL